LHELTTNEAKYGALSVPDGHVQVEWSRAVDGRLALCWTETGGPNGTRQALACVVWPRKGPPGVCSRGGPFSAHCRLVLVRFRVASNSMRRPVGLFLGGP
jgi:hypothetical protein